MRPHEQHAAAAVVTLARAFHADPLFNFLLVPRQPTFAVSRYGTAGTLPRGRTTVLIQVEREASLPTTDIESGRFVCIRRTPGGPYVSLGTAGRALQVFSAEVTELRSGCRSRPGPRS